MHVPNSEPFHCRWTIFNDHEKAIFIHEQRVFSKEQFDPAKLTLNHVNLDFAPGYRLVRAEIEPHTITLEGGGDVSVKETSKSYFLYNSGTDDLIRKVIPLTPNSDSVHLANRLLNITITSGTALEYAKYFGLVVESADHNESFFFIDHLKEIPWSESRNMESRERLIGMLAALSPLRPNGHFDVGLHEERGSWLLGNVYRLTMPCIFQQSGFSAKLSVTPDGTIGMDEDFPLSQETFKDLSRSSPYYRIEPTGQLKVLLDRQGRRNRRIAGAAGALFLLLGILALCGSIFTAVGFSIWLLDFSVRVGQR